MRSIYKYNIMEVKDGIIEGPITKLLTAQAQHGSIMVWAEVDTEAENVKYQVIPVGTGWPLDAPTGGQCILDTHQYIGIVQFADGGLVFHIYAKKLTPAPVKAKTPEPVKKALAKNATGGTLEVSVINPEILSVFTR